VVGEVKQQHQLENDVLRRKQRLLRKLQEEVAKLETEINHLEQSTWAIHRLLVDYAAFEKRTCGDALTQDSEWGQDPEAAEVRMILLRTQTTLTRIVKESEKVDPLVVTWAASTLHLSYLLQQTAYTLSRAVPMFDLLASSPPPETKVTSLSDCGSRIVPSRPGLYAIKANGYRSVNRLLCIALEKMERSVNRLEKDPKKNTAKEIMKGGYMKYMVALNTVMNKCAIILHSTSPDCIFPRRGCEDILDEILQMEGHDCFYGKYFGLQFSDSLRLIFTGLLMTMASFGKTYSSQSHELFNKCKALINSPLSLCTSKSGDVAAHFRAPDVHFLTSFWNLQETVMFVSMDTAIRTKTPDVNIILKIPAIPIMVPKNGWEKAEVRPANGLPNLKSTASHLCVGPGLPLRGCESSGGLLHHAIKTVQVRLLSFHLIDGQLTSQKDLKKRNVMKSVTDDFMTMSMDRVETGNLMSGSMTASVAPGSEAPATDRRKKAELSDALIFHAHGGGFVAQTSKAHLNYLRDYASSVEVPILSIDYSLAPEFPYPVALHETFYAYCWCLQNAAQLGWSGKTLVLAGDSAGANLVVAATMLAIVNDIRTPDFVFPIYPALNAFPIPSPSRILSMLDPLLGIGILLKCLESYCGDASPYDPFMSPSLCPPSILRKFPATCIMAAEMDPLLDDAVDFAQQLHKVRTIRAEVTIKTFRLTNNGFVLPERRRESQHASRRPRTEYAYDDGDDKMEGPSTDRERKDLARKLRRRVRKKIRKVVTPVVVLRKFDLQDGLAENAIAEGCTIPSSLESKNESTFEEVFSLDQWEYGTALRFEVRNTTDVYRQYFSVSSAEAAEKNSQAVEGSTEPGGHSSDEEKDPLADDGHGRIPLSVRKTTIGFSLLDFPSNGVRYLEKTLPVLESVGNIDLEITRVYSPSASELGGAASILVRRISFLPVSFSNFQFQPDLRLLVCLENVEASKRAVGDYTGVKTVKEWGDFTDTANLSNPLLDVPDFLHVSDWEKDDVLHLAIRTEDGQAVGHVRIVRPWNREGRREENTSVPEATPAAPAAPTTTSDALRNKSLTMAASFFKQQSTVQVPDDDQVYHVSYSVGGQVGELDISLDVIEETNEKNVFFTMESTLPHGFLGFNRIDSDCTKAVQKAISILHFACGHSDSIPAAALHSVKAKRGVMRRSAVLPSAAPQGVQRAPAFHEIHERIPSSVENSLYIVAELPADNSAVSLMSEGNSLQVGDVVIQRMSSSTLFSLPDENHVSVSKKFNVRNWGNGEARILPIRCLAHMAKRSLKKDTPIPQLELPDNKGKSGRKLLAKGSASTRKGSTSSRKGSTSPRKGTTSPRKSPEFTGEEGKLSSEKKDSRTLSEEDRENMKMSTRRPTFSEKKGVMDPSNRAIFVAPAKDDSKLEEGKKKGKSSHLYLKVIVCGLNESGRRELFLSCALKRKIAELGGIYDPCMVVVRGLEGLPHIGIVQYDLHDVNFSDLNMNLNGDKVPGGSRIEDMSHSRSTKTTIRSSSIACVTFSLIKPDTLKHVEQTIIPFLYKLHPEIRIMLVGTDLEKRRVLLSMEKGKALRYLREFHNVPKDINIAAVTSTDVEAMVRSYSIAAYVEVSTKEFIGFRSLANAGLAVCFGEKVKTAGGTSITDAMARHATTDTAPNAENAEKCAVM